MDRSLLLKTTEKFKNNEKTKVLEIGTIRSEVDKGDGHSTALFLKNGFDVISIDTEQKHLDICRENLENFEKSGKLSLIKGDGLDYIKNSKEKFDIIYLDAMGPSDSICHDFHLECFLECLKNLRDKNSVILVDDYNGGTGKPTKIINLLKDKGIKYTIQNNMFCFETTEKSFVEFSSFYSKI